MARQVAFGSENRTKICLRIEVVDQGQAKVLRMQYPGAIYHVMDRGDRQEDIFVDDVDRQDFIKTLAEACQKTDWQVHA